MPPDLVICDLVMPGMDGFEVVEKLSESDLSADVPIMILTSQQLTDADRERLNGRVAGIMAKHDDLRANLERWLDRASRLSRTRRRSGATSLSRASEPELVA